MSKEQKRQDPTTTPGGGSNAPGARPSGPLPGLGGASSNPAVPGLPSQQSKAPLPGISGAPSKAPLPRIGAGGPSNLPGMGKKPAAEVPAFLRQESEAAQPIPSEGPSREDIARDPFGHAPVPSTTAGRTSFAASREVLTESRDPSISYSGSDAGKSKKPLIIALVVVAGMALAIGFMLGNGKSTRVELNIAIRDALIVQYEIEQAGKLFNDIQAVINAALNKAGKRDYDEEHLPYLSGKVSGNPIKANLFTERNYKRFDILAVTWLMEYNKKWFELDKLIQEHRMKTQFDEAALKKAKPEMLKLIQNQYGVVFARNKKADNHLEGNLVVVAAGEEEGKLKVQAANGSYGEDRSIYNPEPGDAKLSEEPAEYVVLLGQASKQGLLANASQTHFKEYMGRLKAMSDLMRGMNELQGNLLGKIGELASQDPVMLGGINPESELDRYISKSKSASAAAAK